MAHTLTAFQTVSRASALTPTFTAADGTNGNAVPNNGGIYLRIKNTSGSAVTVSISVGRTVDGSAPAAKTITVPATTGDVCTGHFPPGDYNQPDGNLWLDFSSGTGVTFAAICPQ